MMIIERKNVVIEVTSYGKSMYGGWYANFTYITDDLEHNPNWRSNWQELRERTHKFDGVRRDTLQELCNWLGVSRTALKGDVMRWDN